MDKKCVLKIVAIVCIFVTVLCTIITWLRVILKWEFPEFFVFFYGVLQFLASITLVAVLILYKTTKR